MIKRIDGKHSTDNRIRTKEIEYKGLTSKKPVVKTAASIKKTGKRVNQVKELVIPDGKNFITEVSTLVAKVEIKSYHGLLERQKHNRHVKNVSIFEVDLTRLSLDELKDRLKTVKSVRTKTMIIQEVENRLMGGKIK